jgi:PilZ domain-containing protein
MKERRFAFRFQLALPISVSGVPALEEILQGQTRDISAWGVYFTLNRRLELGTRFNISILLPETLTERTRVSVNGQVKVVRVEETDGVKHVGIAARMENREIVRLGRDWRAREQRG